MPYIARNTKHSALELSEHNSVVVSTHAWLMYYKLCHCTLWTTSETAIEDNPQRPSQAETNSLQF